MARKFWWGGKEGKRCTCYASWERMTQPKYAGGLGLWDLKLLNLALLAKQVWRIIQEPLSLSMRILKEVDTSKTYLLSQTHLLLFFL
jgi:hypothetical protein